MQTQVRKETGTHTQPGPRPRQIDIYQASITTPTPTLGTPPCPLAHTEEKAAKSAGTLAPEHGMSPKLRGCHDPFLFLFLDCHDP